MLNGPVRNAERWSQQRPRDWENDPLTLWQVAYGIHAGEGYCDGPRGATAVRHTASVWDAFSVSAFPQAEWLKVATQIQPQ